MPRSDSAIAEYMRIRRYVLTLTQKADGKSVPLPSILELSELFQVSRPTVSRAMKALTDEGYVIGRRGIGSFTNPAKRFRPLGNQPMIGLLVGDGMSREGLLARIAAEGLDDYFVWEGQHPVTDVPKYHTLADALIACLAKSDDLGLTIPAKITSYCAAGRPVLACMDGEGARVVTEAGCGFACPAGDTAALTENLLRLMALSSAQRAAMGARGRAYNAAHFDRSTLLAQLADFVLEGTQND